MPVLKSPPPTLKRSLSLTLITFYGLGTIIGAGIYVLVGKVAARAGMFAPLAFLVAALIATLTAFTYAELSSRYPKSAGEAAYVEAAFHRRWLAALAGWAVVAIGLVSAATIANGFVGYFRVFFDVPGWLLIVLLVTGLGAVAAWGISESVWIATAVTLLEIGGLLFVVVIAGDSLATLPARVDELLPPLAWPAWSGILIGAFLAFYAFIGFEDMVNVAEEVKDPRRNLPLSIFLALIVSGALYMLVATTAVLTLSPAALGASDAPLAAIVAARNGTAGQVISFISLAAVINGALIQIIMASRVMYGMAHQGGAPAVFGRVHPLTHTPVIGTVAVTGVVLVLALAFPIVTLAEVTSFITLGIFALMHAALCWMKYRRVPSAAKVSFPVWIPVLGFVVTAALIVFQAGTVLSR